MDNGIEIPDYLAKTTLRLIGDKWRTPIIRDLFTRIKRFSELMRSISDITQKVLTSHLRTMEQAGLVTREIHPQVPPKVEYTLTETRYSLEPIPDSMAAWGTAYERNIGQMQTREEP